MKAMFDRERIVCRLHARQHGFALVSAIFILVILSAMAAFIVHVSTHLSVGHAADMQGIRAYQAARTGTEWGLFNHLRNTSCAATSSFALTGNLTGFAVTVQCTPSGGAISNDENGTAIVMRRIIATACNQPTGAGVCPNPSPGSNYIERELVVVAGS